MVHYLLSRNLRSALLHCFGLSIRARVLFELSTYNSCQREFSLFIFGKHTVTADNIQRHGPQNKVVLHEAPPCGPFSHSRLPNTIIKSWSPIGFSTVLTNCRNSQLNAKKRTVTIDSRNVDYMFNSSTPTVTHMQNIVSKTTNCQKYVKHSI